MDSEESFASADPAIADSDSNSATDQSNPVASPTMATSPTALGDGQEPEDAHHLQFSWTLWFDSPANDPAPSGADWSSNIKKVVSFDSAEDFWCVFNNLAKCSGVYFTRLLFPVPAVACVLDALQSVLPLNMLFYQI